AEALGVGLVLPLFVAYLGFGVAPNRDSMMLASGHGLLALASALASGLSDEVSDRLGGKRTCATIFGSAATRRSIEILLVLGGFACCAAPYFTELPSWIGTPAGLFVLYAARGVRRASPFAVTNAFRALGTYKARLHECIWGGTALLTVSLWAYSLWVR
ncbi:MAG: prenyltransferase, partial [Myxococcota bacterium]